MRLSDLHHKAMPEEITELGLEALIDESVDSYREIIEIHHGYETELQSLDYANEGFFDAIGNLFKKIKEGKANLDRKKKESALKSENSFEAIEKALVKLLADIDESKTPKETHVKVKFNQGSALDNNGDLEILLKQIEQTTKFILNEDYVSPMFMVADAKNELILNGMKRLAKDPETVIKVFDELNKDKTYHIDQILKEFKSKAKLDLIEDDDNDHFFKETKNKKVLTTKEPLLGIWHPFFIFLTSGKQPFPDFVYGGRAFLLADGEKNKNSEVELKALSASELKQLMNDILALFRSLATIEPVDLYMVDVSMEDYEAAEEAIHMLYDMRYDGQSKEKEGVDDRIRIIHKFVNEYFETILTGYRAEPKYDLYVLTLNIMKSIYSYVNRCVMNLE